jgi:hypothetical protein
LINTAPDAKVIEPKTEQSPLNYHPEDIIDQNKPVGLTETTEMNPVSENAIKSTQHMGEFAPILESDHPELPVKGPFMDKSTGSTYKGQFENGMKNGLGKEVYKNGSYYEGHWLNNQRSGQGRLVSCIGDLFQGEFQNGQAEGKGTLFTAKTGTTYTGAFQNDKPNGKGKEEYADGSFYMGDFKDGLMTGNCKFVFKDGGIYNGPVINGIAEGSGTYRYKDPNKFYEGEFKANKKHGKGVLTTQKYVYTGSFVNGQMEGPGELKWITGKKLTGTFYQGKADGEFEQINAQGVAKKVLYDKGKFVKNL